MYTCASAHPWQICCSIHPQQRYRQGSARGFRSKAYDSIRSKPLVQTTGADLLVIVHTNGNCVAHYLRRLHNLAVDLGWLPWPVLAKRAWPKIRSTSKRAITAEEHEAVIASEKNAERRAYYEFALVICPVVFLATCFVVYSDGNPERFARQLERAEVTFVG